MLVRNQDIIPESVRKKIIDGVASWLVGDDYIPEYMCIAFVKLLSSEKFKDTEVLFSFFGH